MALCRITRGRLFRLNITSFVWFLFSGSFISLLVTCAYVTVYLDEDPDDRDYHYEFPDVEDQTEIKDRIRLGDDVYDDLNLISSKLIDSSQIELMGWWMPHVRWNPEIDVLSVRCKPDSIRAIYQYLPIHTIQGLPFEESESDHCTITRLKVHRGERFITRLNFTMFTVHMINSKASVKSIYFSATSSSSNLKTDDTYNIMVESAMYSAIAVLKYTDNSHDRMRLDFPTGSHPYIKAELDKVVPSDKELQSITVMLCCYGYHGSVKFLDVIVKPIIDPAPTPGPHVVQVEPSHFIDQCSDLPVFKQQPDHVSYHAEQIFASDLKEVRSKDEVALVTHVSMDRIDILQKIIEQWKGPLSVALFVPTKSKSDDENHEWKRYYIKKKLKDTNFQTKCDLTAFYAKTVDDEYPINHLRNQAIRQAKTPYLLLLDADFIPSPNLEQSFQSTLRGFKPSLPENKVAYVVPAFEYSEDAKEPLRDPPSTKDELKEKIFGVGANIIPFRHFTSPESHRPTDYRAWYTSKEPYKVINYEDKFEPYIIVKKTSDLPFFDESFSGYGMNKATHTMELMAAGFTFEVLPSIWAIHLPHRITAYNTNFLTNPLQRLQNRITRFEFVAKIMRKYGLGPCVQTR